MNFESLVNEVLEESSFLNKLGHTMLDIAGLIPGAGEVADVANAVLYCAEKEYLLAALSLISCIPVIGDIVGKGTKLGLILGKLGSKIINLRKTIKDNKFLIDKLFDRAEKIEKLAPYVPKMKEAVDVFTKSNTLNPT